MNNSNIDIDIMKPGFGENVLQKVRETNSPQFFEVSINEKALLEILHKERKLNRQEKIVLEHVIVKKKYFFRFVKRTFDIVSSLIGIACSLIPMLIIAIFIKLNSKGPIIFKQERLGLNGKPFTVYKFRSMYFDSEKNGAQWAEQNDPRVTKVGRFLRKTRLDELPQFFNIFLGNMSFIGPRPERKIFYDIFEEYIVGFNQRLKVKPGLTGWAQVNGGYDLLPEEKIIYDLEYIKKQSFLMDIKCIIKTFKVLFTHNGAR